MKSQNDLIQIKQNRRNINICSTSLQEDALACILALDGFYVDGRNIRASYGTSKYCSAFIKNVRCNNPDCTYLHGMGDSEDTFTKQEIQAGYVTSGRDVLARQQQLSAGTGARRRVGSGGPSNTGKVSSSPVFPPPTYEEPSKPSQSNLVPPPPPATSSTTQFPPVSSASLHRANSNTGIAGFSAVAAGNGPIPSLAGVAKMLRSSSLPLANTPSKPEPALTPAEMLSRQQEELRKKHPQNSTNTNRKKSSTTESANSQPTSAIPSAPAPASAGPAPPSTTAASIVAGVHTTSKPNAPPARHTTLTALTPLKRASSIPDKKDLSKSGNGLSSDILLSNNMPLSKGLSSSQQAAFLEQRKEAFISSGPPRDPSILHDTLRSNSTIFTNDTNKSINTDSAIAALKAPATPGIGSIGGKVIGGSSNVPISAPLGSFGNQNSSVGLSGLGNLNNSGHGGLLGSIGPSSLGGVGMSNVGGQPIGGFGGESNSGAIGGSNILSQPLLSNLGEIKANGNRPAGLFGNSDFGSIGGTGLWDQLGNNYPPRYPPAPSQGDNIAIGGSHLGGQPNTSNLGNNILSGNGLSGSSALASMLGIQLPTGVGSLRETLWASSTPLRGPSSDLKANAPTPIGAGIKKSSDGVIIGGHSSMNSAGSVPIGGYGTSVGPTSSGNQNDIALLQSLLPGVHINGGNTYQPAAPNTGGGGNPFGGSDWGGLGNSQPTHQSHHQYQQQEDSWNNGYSAAPGPPKQNNARNQPNIW
jgi:hypothetical protein